jgi:hypothetical protein
MKTAWKRPYQEHRVTAGSLIVALFVVMLGVFDMLLFILIILIGFLFLIVIGYFISKNPVSFALHGLVVFAGLSCLGFIMLIVFALLPFQTTTPDQKISCKADSDCTAMNCTARWYMWYCDTHGSPVCNAEFGCL